jgi:hypothetical protein
MQLDLHRARQTALAREGLRFLRPDLCLAPQVEERLAERQVLLTPLPA